MKGVNTIKFNHDQMEAAVEAYLNEHMFTSFEEVEVLDILQDCSSGFYTHEIRVQKKEQPKEPK